MSEAVEILIKADDQASQKFATTAENMDKSLKRVNSMLADMKSPAEEYKQKLDDLAAAHEAGAINAEQYAAAQAHVAEAFQDSEQQIKSVGSSAKKTSETVSGFAKALGAEGAASAADFAANVSGTVEKLSSFAEVSKQGKAGALAFKLGLVALAATIGSAIGKAIGDVIFETKKFTRELERAKEASKELEDRLQKTRSVMMENAKEDIELIRDPDKKRAEYKALLDTLNKDIDAVSKNVTVSQKAVDDWADAWQITGNRKEYAKQAQEQLENDKARLAALRDERDELQKITSERTRQNEELAKANEAKDKSEAYIAQLKQEVEYLAATKEEQLLLDAARNTTIEDRGEAERLLKERDAILAKAEAQKELEEAQKRAEEERAKAAEKAIQDAQRERDRIEGIVRTENERLALRALELEQGKEAAKVQALIAQGVEEAAAKQIAATESALQAKEDKAKAEETNAQEAAKEKQRIADLVKAEQERLALKKLEAEQGKEAAKAQALINQGVDEANAKKLAAAEAEMEKEKTPLQKPKETGALVASESRLLTSGRNSDPMDKTNKILDQTQKHTQEIAKLHAKNLELQQKIAENTAKGSKLVAVS
jgi:hypothetical protein